MVRTVSPWAAAEEPAAHRARKSWVPTNCCAAACIRTIVLPCSIDGIVTGCILAVGRIVGESAALLFTAGAAEVIANGVLKAYTSNGATLSVLLYLRAFEDGDFDSAWAIGAVLLVLVLAINLAARLAKTKLKQKQ